MLGLLYDIHGNLPALEKVLEQADSEGVSRWLLGGDYGTPSPWPLETLDRLKQLPDATWIRGNGERWLREPPEDRPEVMGVYEFFRGGVPEDVVDWLYALPPQAELDGVLYVHGSPVSDVESFAPEPEEDEARFLAGVRDRMIVFGHSHQQFRRPGPDGTHLLNPGSVGMPLDGDRAVRVGGAHRRRRVRVPAHRVRRGAGRRRVSLDGRRVRRVCGSPDRARVRLGQAPRRA